jgi:hypothetical protein
MNEFGVNAKTRAGLGAQDTSQLLQKLFTGRVVGPSAFPTGGVSGVVQTSTDTTCIVTVDGFDPTGQATLTCLYQPVPGSGDPPTGTACFISCAANGEGLMPWVTAFSGWPS